MLKRISTAPSYRLIKMIGVFTLINFLQPLVSFALLPVFSKKLSIAEYAVYGYSQNITSFTVIVCAFYVQATVINFYYSFLRVKEAFIETILNFILIAGLGFLILSFLVGDYLFSIFLANSIRFFPEGFIAVATGVFQTYTVAYITFLRNEEALSRFFYVSILIVLVGSLAQLYVLLFTHLGAEGVLLGRFFGFLAGFLWIFINRRLRKNKFVFTLSKRILAKVLNFSLVIMPSAAFAWGYQFVDRFIFLHFIGEDLGRAGRYTLASTVASVGQLFIYSVQGALQPAFYKAYTDRVQGEEKIRRMEHNYMNLVLLASSFVVAGSFLFDFVFDKPEYKEAMVYVPFFVGGFIWEAVVLHILNRIYFGKKRLHFFLITIFNFTLSASLNLIFLMHFGLKGLLFSLIISKIFMLFPSYFLSKKSVQMPFNYRDLLIGPVVVNLIILMTFEIFVAFKYSLKMYAPIQLAMTVLCVGLLHIIDRVRRKVNSETVQYP